MSILAVMDAPMDLRPLVLECDTVRLEPLTLSHAPDLLEASREPSTWRYLLIRQPESVVDMERYIAANVKLAEEGCRLPFAVIERASDRAVGVTCYYDFDRANRWLEIGGTWYAVRAQRTAVNRRCKLLLLRHAFDELGANRVRLKTDAENARSRAAIERIGATFEGVLRRYQIYWHGAVRDTAVYSVVRSEWPEVRRRLESLAVRRVTPFR